MTIVALIVLGWCLVAAVAAGLCAAAARGDERPPAQRSPRRSPRRAHDHPLAA